MPGGYPNDVFHQPPQQEGPAQTPPFSLLNEDDEFLLHNSVGRFGDIAPHFLSTGQPQDSFGSEPANAYSAKEQQALMQMMQDEASASAPWLGLPADAVQNLIQDPMFLKELFPSFSNHQSVSATGGAGSGESVNEMPADVFGPSTVQIPSNADVHRHVVDSSGLVTGSRDQHVSLGGPVLANNNMGTPARMDPMAAPYAVPIRGRAASKDATETPAPMPSTSGAAAGGSAAGAGTVGGAGGPIRTKRAYGVACERCKKAKKKCDNRTPCQNCIAHSKEAAQVCARSSAAPMDPIDRRKMRQLSQVAKVVSYMKGYREMVEAASTLFNAKCLRGSFGALFQSYEKHLHTGEVSPAGPDRDATKAISENERFCVRVLIGIGAKAVGAHSDGNAMMAEQKWAVGFKTPSIWSICGLLELINAFCASDVFHSYTNAAAAVSMLKFTKFPDDSVRHLLTGRCKVRQIMVDPFSSAQERFERLWAIREEMGLKEDFDSEWATRDFLTYTNEILLCIGNPILFKMMALAGTWPLQPVLGLTRQALQAEHDPDTFNMMMDISLMGPDFHDPAKPTYMSPDPPTDPDRLKAIEGELTHYTEFHVKYMAFAKETRGYTLGVHTKEENRIVGVDFFFSTIRMVLSEALGRNAEAEEFAGHLTESFMVFENPFHPPISLCPFAFLAAFLVRHRMARELEMFIGKLCMEPVFSDARRVPFHRVLQEQLQRMNEGALF